MTRINKLLFLALVVLMPVMLRAQNISHADVVNKNWNIVAMKCPEKIAASTDDQFIHFYGTLKLMPENVNNLNYGTYDRVYRDQRDNPREMGNYSLKTDEKGITILTLYSKKWGVAEYIVEMASANYMTFSKQGSDVKCSTAYAVAP